MYSSKRLDFTLQDEGHTSHNPLTWKVLTTFYNPIGQYPYKKYNGKIILLGPLKGLESYNKKNIKSNPLY